jgi:predicted unusual protein kinase regulating ubiquinone biosynthesis (AarF/ABC1/UbiB family)
VLPSNRIGYVDFGIVGRLAPQVRQSHVYYAWNLFRGNVEAAADEFMHWVTPSAATDVASARAELVRIIENYLTALSLARRTGSAEVSSAELQSMAVIRRRRMIVDPGTVLCIKALLTTSAVVFELVPDFDLRGEEQRFFSGMLAEWSNEFTNPEQIVETAFDYAHRFQRALEKVEARGAMSGHSTPPVSRRTLRGLALLNLIALGCIVWLLSGAQFPLVSLRSDWKLILQGAAFVITLPLVIILWEIRHLPRDD